MMPGKPGQASKLWPRSHAFPNGKPNMRCAVWNDPGNSRCCPTKGREDAMFTRLRPPKGCRICTGAVYDRGGAVYDTKGVQYPAPKPSIEPSLSLAQPSADAAAGAESILSRAQEDAFAAFWTAYPKKRGKLAAKRAWKARKPPLQKVLNTLAALSASHEWRKDNGQFIPYPASWLNAGGWDDEPTSVAPPPESFI